MSFPFVARSGLRYYMRHWFWVTAVTGVAAISFILLGWLAVFLVALGACVFLQLPTTQRATTSLPAVTVPQPRRQTQQLRPAKEGAVGVATGSLPNTPHQAAAASSTEAHAPSARALTATVEQLSAGRRGRTNQPTRSALEESKSQLPGHDADAGANKHAASFRTVAGDGGGGTTEKT